MLPILDNFIVFEGLDGAGTTTQSKLLESYFQSINRDCFLTFEPTCGPIGSFIRQNILKKKITINSLSLLYLYLADRSEHLYGDGGIIEALNKKKFVISDRYFYSTIAYQSLSVPFEETCRLCDGFLQPNLLFYIDTPVDICLSRIEKRGAEKELFEQQELLSAIQKNYEKAFCNIKSGVNFFKLDGTKSENEIFSQIKKITRQVYDIK